jgi:hypothetical protein
MPYYHRMNSTAEQPPAFALPWRMLVAPSLTWRKVAERPQYWPAIAAQWLLAALGWLLTARLMLELSSVAGVPVSPGLYSPLGRIISAVFLLPVVLAGNAALAGATYGVLLVFGQRVAFSRLLTWVSYAVLPAALGAALSRVIFLFAQPLAQDHAAALALQLRPFAFGLVTFWPHTFPPLSFVWFLASYFDIFALWGWLLAALGVRRLLGLSARQGLWLILALVLLFTIALTGYWQVMRQYASS